MGPLDVRGYVLCSARCPSHCYPIDLWDTPCVLYTVLMRTCGAGAPVYQRDLSFNLLSQKNIGKALFLPTLNDLYVDALPRLSRLLSINRVVASCVPQCCVLLAWFAAFLCLSFAGTNVSYIVYRVGISAETSWRIRQSMKIFSRHSLGYSGCKKLSITRHSHNC